MKKSFLAFLRRDARGELADFDEHQYLLLNPDVAAAIKKGHFSSGADHWLRHGRSEGRRIHPQDGLPKDFDEDEYLRLNPDVAVAVRKGPVSSGAAHWLRHGKNEGRRIRDRREQPAINNGKSSSEELAAAQTGDVSESEVAPLNKNLIATRSPLNQEIALRSRKTKGDTARPSYRGVSLARTTDIVEFCHFLVYGTKPRPIDLRQWYERSGPHVDGTALIRHMAQERSIPPAEFWKSAFDIQTNATLPDFRSCGPLAWFVINYFRILLIFTTMSRDLLISESSSPFRMKAAS